MSVDRVEQGQAVRPRTEPPEIVRNLVAEADVSVTAGQEVSCQRCIEELRLMGNHVVEYGNHLATLPQTSCYESKGRGEPRHPVAHHHQIRLPLADFLERPDI